MKDIEYRDVLKLPKGEEYRMGLRYVDPQKLIEELEEGEFCGYAEFHTKGPDGPERGRILFDAGKIIAASHIIPESGNAFLRATAVERILRNAKNYVNVYKLDDTDLWLAKDLNASRLFTYVPEEKIAPPDISPEMKEVAKQISMRMAGMAAANGGGVRPVEMGIEKTRVKYEARYDFSEYGEQKAPDSEIVSTDRERLLDKFRLKEPEDRFADVVLVQYRDGTDGTDRTEKKMLEYIKETIKIMAGDEIGTTIIKNQIAELGIDEEYVTTEQIEELIYSLRQNVLKGIFGTDKADEIYNRLKEDVTSKT